jgi:hypothetical protein
MLGPDPTNMVADLKASGAAKLLPWKTRDKAPDPGEGWEDYELDFMGSNYLGFEHPEYGWQQSICGPSLRGFMDFIDADGCPCAAYWQDEDGKTQFPVAVRFSKEQK